MSAVQRGRSWWYSGCFRLRALRGECAALKLCLMGSSCCRVASHIAACFWDKTSRSQLKLMRCFLQHGICLLRLESQNVRASRKFRVEWTNTHISLWGSVMVMVVSLPCCNTIIVIIFCCLGSFKCLLHLQGPTEEGEFTLRNNICVV